MWFSPRYTYVPSLFNLPPFFHPNPLLSGVITHGVARPVLHGSLPAAIYFIYGKVHVSLLLSIHATLSFLCCVHKSVFYVCGSSTFNDWDHRNAQKDPFPPTPKFSSLPRHPAFPPIQGHHSALHLGLRLPAPWVPPKQTLRWGFGWRLLLQLGLPWWLSW